MPTMQYESEQKVVTPLGLGRKVYTLGNGQVVVEFDHGGGEIFFPEQVREMAGVDRTYPRKQSRLG